MHFLLNWYLKLQATDHSVELSALRGKLITAAEKVDTAPSTPQIFSVTPTTERLLPEVGFNSRDKRKLNYEDIFIFILNFK